MTTDDDAVSAPGEPAGPVRTCIGCRRRDSSAALLRVVLAPTSPPRAVVDERRRAPGRGAWLHPGRSCLDLAERRRALRRALRADGDVDAGAVSEWLNTHEDRGARATCVRSDGPPHRGKRVGS